MCNSGRWRGAVALVAFVFCTFAGPSSVRGARLLENEELSLDLGAYASLLGGVEWPEEEATDYGASLGLARLKLSGRHREYARTTIQIAGESGDVVLLDAVAEWIAFDPIYFRAGRFKTSVSREYLISAARLDFVSRALLNEFVPRRRLGVETYGRFPLGDVLVQPQVGLFQPNATSFEEPQGELLTARVLVESPVGVGFHVGYGGHVFAENRHTRSVPGGTITSRVVPFDDPLDVAVTYRKYGLDLHLEGLAILDPPGNEAVTAGYVQAAYRFGPRGGIQFQPSLAYDVVDFDDVAHRITGGLNVYWWDTHFHNILDYRYQTVGGRELHSLLVLIHGEV